MRRARHQPLAAAVLAVLAVLCGLSCRTGRIEGVLGGDCNPADGAPSGADGGAPAPGDGDAAPGDGDAAPGDGDPLDPDAPYLLQGSYEALKDWPASYADVLVAAWDDNDLVAAFAITIDDNQGQDVDWWLAKGEEYGFPFTWFLIPNKAVEYVTVAAGGYWAQYVEVFAAGHDIQSHTFSHSNELAAGNTTIEQEYADAIIEIETRIPGTEVQTIAHVGGVNKDYNDIELAMTYYLGGRGTTNHINERSFDYTNSRAISSTADILDEATQFIYAPRLFDPQDVKFRGFVCMYFHAITLIEEQTAQRVAEAERVLHFCASHREELWVAWFRNIVKYTKERDAVEAGGGPSTSASDNAISIQLSTQGQLDERHDYPLTLKVKVDTNWRGFTATQGGLAVDARFAKYDGEYYLFVKAVPDRGEILLTRP